MWPVKRLNESNLNFGEVNKEVNCYILVLVILFNLQAFVVAELNTLPRNIPYSVYYSTALKYMETDYVGRISFYVKPVRVTQNKISLYLWNQVRVRSLK